MESNTLMIIVLILASFTFIAISVPVLKNRELLKANKVILIASFSVIISNASLYLEVQTHSADSHSFALLFICYSTITLCFLLLLTLIDALYSVNYKATYGYIICYSILIGLTYGILTVYGNSYIITNIIYGILLSVPVFITVYNMIKNKIRLV